MAKFAEIDEAAFQEWVATRPLHVARVVLAYRPDTLFRMKSTGRRVFIHAYEEEADGVTVTLKVEVRAIYNPGTQFERVVFGVKPEDLEECELPECECVKGRMH